MPGDEEKVPMNEQGAANGTGKGIAFKKSSLSGREKILIIVVVILVILCLALIIALGVVASQQKRAEHAKTDSEGEGSAHKNGDMGKATPFCSEDTQLEAPKPPKSAGLYDDLSEEEIEAVYDYLLKDPTYKFVSHEKARADKNSIYLIELQQPPKDEALDYLDGSGAKPARKARVMALMGAPPNPRVQEFLVTLNADHKVESVKKRSVSGWPNQIHYDKRPADAFELGMIDKAMRNVTDRLYQLLKESYGYTYGYNCTMRCLTYTPNSPPGVKSLERKHWVYFERDVEGLYEHPIGFQVLYNAKGSDPSKWFVESIFYHNDTHDSVEALLKAYNDGSVYKVKIPVPSEEELIFSSYRRRGDPQPAKPLRPPQMYEPDGKRYTLSGRHVEYMGWSFDFRIRSSSGVQIFDLKFKGERIIYELSIQEAEAWYSGYTPARMHMNYLDAYWGLGYSKYEMVPGVDCPNTATFFNNTQFVNTGKPQKIQNAICIFELNTGIPLRRHFDNDFNGGYKFYGGMPGSALVLRTVTTAYNYDYVFDYLFYPNGAVEVRVGATGYVQAVYWTNREQPYGNKLHDITGGTIHDHIINYKVDFDVAGRKNYYQTIDIEVENITDPFYPGRRHIQKVLRRRTKKTEKEAVYKYNFETPKYLNFYSDEKNRNGVNKGYRIQLKDVMKMSYPESYDLVNGAPWTLNQLVVTKYKADEERSSSIYNQADPYEPVVNFKKFFEDDEAIENEDLVAWVTTGTIHIPHSEDLPNTATAANTFGFFIRPFNYFDEDPSIASTDGVLILPTDSAFSGTIIEQYGKKNDSCIPKQKNINFKGTYGG